MDDHDYSEPICDAEQFEMLKQAREKGQKLLDELLKQQAEVEANPPKISAEDLEQGRYAMQQAIASTRRMLASLDEASKIAATENN
jgi:hypothetical protein